MPLRLIYVMDPLCSWCFGFTPVLQNLLQLTEPKGVALQVIGGARREWKTDGSKAVSLKAGHEGGRIENEPPCRAIVTVRDLAPELVWPMTMKMQEAFHCKGVDIIQSESLARIAERIGLERSAFLEHFNSPAMHEATQENFEWVESLGITGYPTLLTERSNQLALLSSGYHSAEELSPKLKQWLES